MKSIGLAAALLFTTTTLAQLAVPRIVQLPTTDFVWDWGNARGDERLRPHFQMVGRERAFTCDLQGSFKPGSHMRDFENMREFEQQLNSTLYFIQDSTYLLNDLYLQNHVQWARLDCKLPEETERNPDKVQEDLDRALERARRDQQRRREREDDN